MRILHLADGPRNIRAERAALLAKKSTNNDIFITGDISQNVLAEDIFKKSKYIPFQPRNLVGLQLKEIIKELEIFIEEIDPDIIHAHNIFMYNIVKKFDIPFVYDDHELWSQEIKYSKKDNLKGQISLFLQKSLYPKWEKEVAKSTVIFVPSEGIVNFYKTKYNSTNVYKLPNMPTLEEIKKIKYNKSIEKELHTVAIGVKTNSKFSFRSINEFVNLWNESTNIGKLMIIGQNDLKSEGNLVSAGRVSHYDCYYEASKGHIGIIPFKPHPYHEFSGANKAYLYLHSGLVLIVPETQIEFKTIIDKLGYGFYFKNYQQIPKYLEKNKKDLLNIDKKAIIKNARKEFILENYRENLTQGYKIAMENH
ncbi:MAG: hypothetical protein ACTSP5_01600 [Candidatus Heimdallarchaeota archaeon]